MTDIISSINRVTSEKILTKLKYFL